MEELNNKLSAGNPIVISKIISKLLENLKNKQESDKLETAEFKFLKEKCLGPSKLVSVVASDTILQFVQENSSLAKNIIADFITIITTSKCSNSNVPYLINNLLLIDIENELSKNTLYKCYYNLRLPQHPLIVILNEDSKSWSPVFKEITYAYKNADKNETVSCYNELYKPVFLYITCNPHESGLSLLKEKLWMFIIHNSSSDILNILLSWMQFERRETIHTQPECRNTIQVNTDLLIQLSDLNITVSKLNQNLLLLWETAALHQLVLNNFDPREIMWSIENILNHHSDTTVLNPVLFMLAKTIPICSSVNLFQLLKLCQFVIHRSKCDVITVQIISASLLQWIANPSSLTSAAVSIANQIFLFLKNNNNSKLSSASKEYIKFSKKFEKLIITNNDVYITMQLYILLEKWKSNDDIMKWLEKLEKAPIFFVIKVVDFLYGLFLADFTDCKINIKAFDLLQKCVDCNKTFSSKVLTIVLYKLTNTVDSTLHYQLLKSIPKMAVLKDNLQKIVGTIQALNKGQNTLKTFSTTLMLDLWKIDNTCYPYLENLLITPYNSQCDKWEFYVTRANVLKELCALKPELYGKEMVAHLSKILNECNNSDGALACALAIEAITLLCKFEVIDAVTTWSTLAPIFKNENRIQVIKSLCCLIYEFPNLSYTEAYPKLIAEVISKLWEYTLLHVDNLVWEAALNALTYFNIEEIVALMPDEYFDEEILNIKNSGHMIPSQCWIHLMKSCDLSRLKVIADFLIKMVSLEISNYLKFVYQVKGTREPVDYSYLPANSVVRGISTYIKSEMFKWKDSVYKEVYLECLRIFSQEYSKPLPPLDWCFLQELVHEPEAKNFCLNIASHQVMLSGTARRFIVNYIENHSNEDDVSTIYNNLKHLANSVQPFTLKPFLEATIYHALDLFKNNNEEMFIAILNSLKTTLQDEAIQESNKIVIAQIIIGIFDETDISSKLFTLLLDCVILFPAKCIDDISSPKSVKEVRTEWFKKAVKIRCHLAKNNKGSPLNWLNEVIEAGSSFPEIADFLYQDFASVFQKQRDNTECVLWVLELIGQIQAVTAEKSNKKEILFLCHIFILATIVFSGHYVLLNGFSDCREMYKLFPRAVATLLEVNHWSICTTQALEWFYHMKMNTENMFSEEFKDMFVQCLQTLRNDDEFHKYMKWTKYLNVEC